MSRRPNTHVFEVILDRFLARCRINVTQGERLPEFFAVTIGRALSTHSNWHAGNGRGVGMGIVEGLASSAFAYEIG
jgi:hypothetical protein